MRFVWLAFGLMALTLGIIGAVLPLLPTVPFLLLAAFCFAQSSDRLHGWLVNHNVFGSPIADWQRSGVIRRKSKWLASLSILATFVLSLALGVGVHVLVIQAVTLGCVSIFIWSRPES